MAPQIYGILRTTAYIIIDGNRISNDTFLGGLKRSGITESAVIECDHVIAETAQNSVELNAMIGETGIGIAMEVKNNLGAGLLESSLEELGLINGINSAEFVEVKVFDGRQMVWRNGFVEKWLGGFL